MAKVIVTLDIPNLTNAQLGDKCQQSGNPYATVDKLQNLLSGVSAGMYDTSFEILVRDSAIVMSATADAADDVITMLAHGLVDGGVVTFSDVGSVVGVSAGVEYYVRFATTDTFKVSTTVSGSPVVSAADTTLDVLTSVAHGLADGQIVRLTDLGTVTGVALATDYYVVNKTNDTFQLALTSGGLPEDLTGVDSDVSYDALLNITTGGNMQINASALKSGSNSTYLQYSLK